MLGDSPFKNLEKNGIIQNLGEKQDLQVKKDNNEEDSFDVFVFLEMFLEMLLEKNIFYSDFEGLFREKTATYVEIRFEMKRN